MNNLLKSVFISTFPVFVFITFVYSIIVISAPPLPIRMVGVLISSIGILAFFLWIFLFKKARIDEYLVRFSSIIFMGTGIGIYGLITEELSILPSIFLIGLLVTWIIYLRWYSVFDLRIDNPILKTGNPLPIFTLEDENQNRVNSNSFLGKPSIFLFYRGNWCPLCMAQIREIVGQYKELERRGVNMVLVSPQPHKFTKSLARKFDMGFHFLVDVKSKVAKQLQIFQKNGLPVGFQSLGYESDTVLPTVILTDPSGIILFTDQTDNYRIRPEPQTFFDILDTYISES